MALTPSPPRENRNPGPSWGYRFLRLADRVLPEALFRPLRAAGTWIDDNLAQIYGSLPETPTAEDTTHRFFAAPDGRLHAACLAGGAVHLLVGASIWSVEDPTGG